MRAVVDFAHQVLEMQDTIEWQAREITRLSEIECQYNELLNSSLDHSQKMVGGMLELLLVPGVAKALSEAGAS